MMKWYVSLLEASTVSNAEHKRLSLAAAQLEINSCILFSFYLLVPTGSEQQIASWLCNN